MDDLIKRLKHCSENTLDEYLHELTGRAADRIEAQAAEIARLTTAYNDLGNTACKQVGELATSNGRKDVELDAARADLQQANREIARLREALEPSGDTKAAYIGEFSFYIPLQDDEGEEVLHKVYVPWDITKEIMKAISNRAALQETANE